MSPTKYKLILADPPWHFRNWSADAPGQTHNRARGANKHYPTDTLENICALKPPADDNAVLLIWTISSHLDKTFDVIKAWGFEYKAVAWVWLKMTKDNSRPRIGQGYHFRQCTELCLLATRGKVPRGNTRSETALIAAPRSIKHSGKPVEQYVKIDAMWPDLYPRLEMFAREIRAGWDVFGNEVDNSISIGVRNEEIQRRESDGAIYSRLAKSAGTGAPQGRSEGNAVGDDPRVNAFGAGAPGLVV